MPIKNGAKLNGKTSGTVAALRIIVQAATTEDAAELILPGCFSFQSLRPARGAKKYTHPRRPEPIADFATPLRSPVLPCLRK